MINPLKTPNFFERLPDASQQEIFETLASAPGLKIERITTLGQCTPAGEWYNQPNREWVMLLQGAAQLLFEDGRELSLVPGDYVDIPAHCKHRVSWTDPAQRCLWLAVHYGAAGVGDDAPLPGGANN